MIVQQEIQERGDEIKLRNTFNTDDIERANWYQRQHTNKGLMYENGELVGREIANIPVHEAAMLESV